MVVARHLARQEGAHGVALVQKLLEHADAIVLFYCSVHVSTRHDVS